MRRLGFVNLAYKGALRSHLNTPRLRLWPVVTFVGNPRFTAKGIVNSKSTFKLN
jgi:hypothetical protein